MHIVVTGGNGFVGRHLCKALLKKGHQVTVIGRHLLPQRPEGEIPPVFAACDGIIHLAGAPIFHRWTPRYKKLIVQSRVNTAHAIYEFLLRQKRRPKVFISASAVGFYGDRGEEVLDETSSPGIGFLASTCVEWEKARERFSFLGMRTVSVRTGVVLGGDGGALSKLLPFFRLGLGGKIGEGRQWFPWVHVDDLVSIYLWALDTHFEGAVNAVAAQSIRNVEFTKTLGKILRRPALLPVPAFVCRCILGEMATALLASQRVVPRVLEQLGVVFKYPTIEGALEQILTCNLVN